MSSKVSSLQSQTLAADPKVCSWVSASAGTGKTKVLTDRLLNLMLMGADPQKILCLTFTKAAASEMKSRLLDKLRNWVLLSDHDLSNALQNHLSAPITTSTLHKARSLYTTILDLPGGIKILTLHSFCQTVLSRFPLEADIPPHFSILEDYQAQHILSEALKISLSKNTLQSNFFWGISHFFKDSTFQETLEEVLSNRTNLRTLIHTYPTIQSYASRLQENLTIPIQIDLFSPKAENNLLELACKDEAFDKKELLEALETIDSKYKSTLERWLHSPSEDRKNLFGEYLNLFLTKDGSILKRSKVDAPKEAERLYRYGQNQNNLHIIQKSLTLFNYAQNIFETYQSLKEKRAFLDFDDLIEKTISLLNTPQTAAWVLYKLDGGIDHILIDEAQDTNPAQWSVIKGLCDDFFRPDKTQRTLFVVGDAKQSIYSFQGAKPEDFMSLRKHFETRSTQIGQTWRNINLDISFRSTPQVLSLVDRIFANDLLKKQILETNTLTHIPFRETHSGHVALWPLILETDQENDLTPWPLPLNQNTDKTLPQTLASHITNQIVAILNKGDILPSTNKPVEPKDILILVRNRGNLSNSIIKDLKRRKIPVAGEDRFSLNAHIAAQDLQTLGDFLIQPLNDLALATILRSPFIGLSEQDLEDLCYNREGSLWHNLIHQASSKTSYSDAYTWLKEIMSQQDYLRPYDLYMYILENMKGRERLIQRLSEEANDAIDEFMNQCLDFERQHSPTLETFLEHLRRVSPEIKRDSSDQHFNQIRIMTVHGSKGLQAPIVIIPEKVDRRDKIDKTLWKVDPDGKIDLMIARPSSSLDTDFTSFLKQEQKNRDSAEKTRLLYVALTRAQDHLYLCGYGKKVDDSSWYSIALNTLGDPEPWNHSILDYHCSETHDQFDIPEYLSRKYITPPSNPSKNTIPEKIDMTDRHRQLGILVHKWFEDLNPLPEDTRYQAALTIAEIMGIKMKEDVEQHLYKTLEHLKNDVISQFFGPDSIAELELTTQDGQLIRLDRVVLPMDLTKPIFILDFKSTLTPPEPGNIPLSIQNQMNQYEKTMKDLYPGRDIELYILWTSSGRLDLLDPATCY